MILPVHHVVNRVMMRTLRRTMPPCSCSSEHQSWTYARTDPSDRHAVAGLCEAGRVMG